MSSWWLPKPGGGLRRMATLSAKDATAWHRLGGLVAEAVEPVLAPGVMGNRARTGAGGWSLRPPGPALVRARGAAEALSRWPALLRTDVADFYPSISSSAVSGALRAVGVHGPDADRAALMVEGWGSDGYPGLPIGPDGSAVVANAVLAEVDRALDPFPYLRWVDDYLVALPSERVAPEALERLDEALGGLGLCRNEAKTSMVEGAVGWLGARSPVAVRGRSCGSAAPGCPTPRAP